MILNTKKNIKRLSNRNFIWYEVVWDNKSKKLVRSTIQELINDMITPKDTIIKLNRCHWKGSHVDEDCLQILVSIKLEMIISNVAYCPFAYNFDGIKYKLSDWNGTPLGIIPDDDRQMWINCASNQLISFEIPLTYLKSIARNKKIEYFLNNNC